MSNWNYNKKKLYLEIEKLELENQLKIFELSKAQLSIISDDLQSPIRSIKDFNSRLRQNRGKDNYQVIERRLEKSSLIISDIDFELAKIEKEKEK